MLLLPEGLHSLFSPEICDVLLFFAGVYKTTILLRIRLLLDFLLCCLQCWQALHRAARHDAR